METSEHDSQLQIAISGKFVIDGPLTDYTQLLNGVCCLIAMDLDRNGNKRTQYLIALTLCEHIKKNAGVLPTRHGVQWPHNLEYNGLITNSTTIDCTVNAKNFMEHTYEEINKFSEMPSHQSNTIKYFVDDNTLVKITYDLTIDIGIYFESDIEQLYIEGFSALRLQIDKDLIDCLKYLYTKSGSKGVPGKGLKKMSSFVAEYIKTLGGKEIFMSPPIIERLYAELEIKLNIELNNVE